jgi:hypothetical protein
MSDSTNSIRVTLRISQSSKDELAKELLDLAPYHRAKRLYLLASMGLAIKHGRTPIASNSIAEPEHVATGHASASVQPSVEVRQSAAEETLPIETAKYEPDLGDLWAAGVMAN